MFTQLIPKSTKIQEEGSRAFLFLLHIFEFNSFSHKKCKCRVVYFPIPSVRRGLSKIWRLGHLPNARVSLDGI